MKHHYKIKLRIIVGDHQDVQKEFYLDDVEYDKLTKKISELGAEALAEVKNFDEFKKPEATDE